MKLDPGMHIGMHLVFFGKSGVTHSLEERGTEFRRERHTVKKRGTYT
jgi:hypothetical protein